MLNPNPELDRAIAEILDEHPQGMSEHALIKALQEPPWQLFDAEALRDDLSLFQTHFIVFNSLYRWRAEWRQQQQCELVISALAIVQEPWQAGTAALTDVDRLAEYYLDWQNLTNTSGEDVADLLKGFWQRVGSPQTVTVTPTELAQAQELFDWPQTQTQTTMADPEAELKRRYRQLLHKNHPDKGGNTATTQKLKWAYQILRTQVTND